MDAFCAFALLSDPGLPIILALANDQCCSRYSENESRKQNISFRGSVTQLLHSLCTLRAAITDDYATLGSG